MQINASSVIHHPRERVHRAYRDELPAIAPFMANIKEIVVVSREDFPGGVRLHNVWAGKGEIPKLVQGIIKPEMVKWDDYAEWDDARWLCTWSIKIRAFTDNMKCGGTNRFEEAGPGATRVILSGNLDIHLKDIPGVPRFLAGSIAPQVEKFIVALIRPNLEQVNGSLERYLDANPG
ncbi:MAG: hypothetical protein Q8P18_29075 [Pseudomonadota bacterium]|nr:hypothetical protein [Pseudomonadota bacterium]